MITLETVMAAAPPESWDGKRSRVGFSPSVPGWSTTGHVAIRFTDYPEGVAAEWSVEVAPKFNANFAGYVKAWTEDLANRVPVTEDESLRIPFVADIPNEVSGECSDCNGSGEHECSCGDIHDCGECDGEGEIIIKRGKSGDIGQAVFRGANGKQTLIQGKFAGLLRGYSVFQFNGIGDDHEEPPLLGVAYDGTVMVCVMPMRGEPRTPEVAA